MARAGPKKVQRYSLEFKRTAVHLSHRPGMQVQAVAEALDIHPFMLSRWRKEVREGQLRGTPAPAPSAGQVFYVCLKALDPTIDPGIDLHGPYLQAPQLHQGRRKPEG